MTSSDELDSDPGAGQLYWDPVEWIKQLPGQPMVGYLGQWDERNWLNVPGPIYGAMTDFSWVGRMSAPRHVLYSATDQEFLSRQPRTLGELRKVMDAAGDDPFGGWALDGDHHWTYASVREWWRGRSRIVDWVQRQAADWASLNFEWRGVDLIRDAQSGLRDYSDYLDGELEAHPSPRLPFAGDHFRPTPGPKIGRRRCTALVTTRLGSLPFAGDHFRPAAGPIFGHPRCTARVTMAPANVPAGTQNGPGCLN